MKMKNIILSLCAVVAFTSCSLDVDVYDQLSPESVLSTEDDVKSAVTGIYHELRQGGWKAYNCSWGSLLTMQVGCTDECVCNYLWESQIDFLWKPETDFLSSFYAFYVPAVTKATSLLERMKKVKISAPLKRGYMAEVRCLRAIWAYDLYDLYGTVPLILDPDIALNPEKAENFVPERPSVEEYVSFIESELLESMKNLKKASQLKENEFGRMTKGIAQVYLLKLYMHEAGQEMHYRNNPTKATEWWTKVRDLTAQMISSHEYALEDDYMSIWSFDNEQNKEIIFAIPCFPVGGLGNMFLAESLPGDYVSKDGIPLTKWGGFRVPWDFYDTYDEADQRRDALMRYYWNGVKEVDMRDPEQVTGISAAIPAKYRENPNTNGSNDASDYVLNRYAEVLLGRAEAINELEGPTQEAKDLVHQVRKRAFVNYEPGCKQYDLIQNLNDKDSFRTHLLAERGWEFCWEGMRRPDLIRHGKLIENAKSRGKDMAEERHVLYPIPQSVIYESPSIDQNPGY